MNNSNSNPKDQENIGQKPLVLSPQKKLYVITEYFYPVATGLEVNTYNTYSIMAQNGWDITVRTSTSNVVKNNIFSNFEEINGIKVLRSDYRVFKYLPFLTKIPLDYPVTIVLHDFLVFPHVYVYMLAWLYKLLGLKRARLIFSSHGLFNFDSSIYPRFSMKLRKFIEGTLGVFLINRTVDAIRAVSEYEKKGLIAQGVNEDLIQVITNGIEEVAFENHTDRTDDTFKEKVKKLGTYIIQIGRLDEVKNQAAAIKSLALLQGKDTKLVLLGPQNLGEYKDQLNTLIERLKVQDRVIFWGSEQGNSKYYLINNAQAVIHMAYVEGFCNAVHEAMSQGKLCIVSKNTALEELIKDGVNGFCALPDDYEEIAKKITYVLDSSNKEHVQRMSQINIELTRGHTWEETAKKVAMLYDF